MTPSTLPHRSPPGHRRRLAATGAVLAVVLAVSMTACGTADQPEVVRPPETDPPATASRQEAGAAATTVPSTSGTTRLPTTAPSSTSTTAASSTTSSTTASSSTSSVVVAADNLAFCQSFEAGLRRLSSDNDVKVGDADGEARLLAQAKVFFGEMAALAPPAIASDWTTLNDMVQAAATPRDVAEPDGAGQTAADNIETWTKANCGFDPGSIG